MQVFICYAEPLKVAQTMWADQKRYNKAIIELKQIIAAIEGAKAWRNHPVCLMYKEHKKWLELYLSCFECYRNYKKSKEETHEKEMWGKETELRNTEAMFYSPDFLKNQELLDARKRRLYSKSPNLYPQFASYGTSEENWYCVSGHIVKYVNGKRVN